MASVFSSGGGSGTPAGASASTASSSSASLASRHGQGRDVLFSAHQDIACLSSDQEFNVNDVPHVYVCVVWRGITGKHAQQLTFVSPAGQVYQTLTVPFMTADTPATADPMIEVDGRQLEAVRAQPGAHGETLVTARLPVGGTFITEYMMVGRWTVQVALDGQRIEENDFQLIYQ
jgi:hypothetical protein